MAAKMAASVSSTTQKDENLETYCLIWLDADVNSSQQNLAAQKQLRASINHLLTFEDDEQCLHYIHCLPKDDRSVLIVSGRFGRMIVPQIVHFRQIISIFVYCMDKKANEEWASPFPKVKGVLVRLDDLIRQIHTDQTEHQHQKVDEPLPISVFKSSEHAEGQSSTGLNGPFIHSQLLVDCLIRMKSTSNEKQEFVTFCKQQYKDNPADLEIVEEFERDYLASRSLWWYTRQSFLFRLLNKALRVQNIDLLYLFRFFIRDLKQELENNKCTKPVHVYRAQRMSKDEIEVLRQSVGEYISMNSFLSTSNNRQQARSFFSSSNASNDVEDVFFKIDADPRLDNIKPFSNITSLSYYPDEEEVLFMIGSIFQVVEIERDIDRVWNIRMALCSGNGHQLQSLLQYMKNKLGAGAISLYDFAGVVNDMGKLDEAEKYYRYYLDQLPADHPSIANCYQALGSVADDKGEYESSLTWYNKALDISTKILRPDHPNIANSYNNIAVVHCKRGNYALARESYKKALIIRAKVYGQDHPVVAASFNNMAAVYREEKEYSKALEVYQAALLIFEKHLPAEHPNIAKTLENIGNLYETIGNFEQALSYFERAAKIFRCALSSTHPNVIKIGQAIKRASSKIK